MGCYVATVYMLSVVGCNLIPCSWCLKSVHKKCGMFLQKVGCWFVSDVDLTGALHAL